MICEVIQKIIKETEEKSVLSEFVLQAVKLQELFKSMIE